MATGILRKRGRIYRRRLTLEQLEERIVLDATVDQQNQDQHNDSHADPAQQAAAGAATGTPAGDAAGASTGGAAAPPSQTVNSGDPLGQVYHHDLNVVLISNAIGDIQGISKAVADDAKVVVYDAAKDSLASVVSQLSHDTEATGEKIGHLAIVSHGAPGQLILDAADDVHSLSTIAQDAPVWMQLASSLAPGARIDLYGCNIGQGEQGQAFILQVASLTGATVWASSDNTGNIMGANWTLETRSADDSHSDLLNPDKLAGMGILLPADPTSVFISDSTDPDFFYGGNITTLTLQAPSLVNSALDFGKFSAWGDFDKQYDGGGFYDTVSNEYVNVSIDGIPVGTFWNANSHHVEFHNLPYPPYSYPVYSDFSSQFNIEEVQWHEMTSDGKIDVKLTLGAGVDPYVGSHISVVFKWHENSPPVKNADIPDIVVNEDFGSKFIPLSGVFSDPDGRVTLELSGATYGDGLHLSNSHISSDYTGKPLLVVQSLPDSTGYADFTITARDAHDLTVSDTFRVNVLPVNDPPVLTLPGGAQTVEETNAFVAQSAAVTDPDATTLVVSLTPTHGKVTLGNPPTYALNPGVTILEGDGRDDPFIMFAGPVSEVSAALHTLQFRPDPDFAGLATVEVAVTDPGNGQTPAVTTSQTLPIEVLPVDDLPRIVEQSVTVTVDQHMDFTVTGYNADLDDPKDVRFSVITPPSHGSVTPKGAVYTDGLGNYSQDFTFVPEDGFFSQDTLQVGFEVPKTVYPSYWQVLGSSTNGGGGLEVGDVDHDGDLDLVRADNLGHLITHLNDGHGDLSHTVSLPVSSTDTRAVFVTDMNNDGWLDVVMGNWDSTGDQVFLNQKLDANQQWNGFQLAATLADPLPAQDYKSMDVGDINGDHFPEIVVAYSSGARVMYINSGGTSFSPVNLPGVYLSESYPTPIHLADTDSDGDLDVITGYQRMITYIVVYDSNGAHKEPLYNPPVSILLNDGSGGFSATNKIDLPGSGKWGTASIGTADLDNDGDQDIVLGTVNSVLKVYTNQGNGTFKMREVGLAPHYTYEINFGDVDHDGDTDVFTSNALSVPEYFLNDGTGHFSSSQPVGSYPYFNGYGMQSVVADFKGDGYPEFVLSHYSVAALFDNPGPSYDQATADVSITINHAPTATSLSQSHTISEDSATFALDPVVVSDQDTGDIITAKVKPGDLSVGSLVVGGGAVLDGNTGEWSITDTLAEVNLALAQMTFTPAANWFGTLKIATHIEDAAHSGPQDGEITIEVTSVNDIPTATGMSATYAPLQEDSGTIVDLQNIVAHDNDVGETLTATLTLSDSTAGTLAGANGGSFDSGTGIWSVSGSEAEVNAALGSVAFTPSANAFGTMLITTHVEDAMHAGPADGLMKVEIKGLPDSPTATDLTVSGNEGQPISLMLSGHDPDRPQASAVNFEVEGHVIPGSGAFSPIVLPGGILTPVGAVAHDGHGNYTQEFTFTPNDNGNIAVSYLFKSPVPGVFADSGQNIPSVNTKEIALGDVDGDGDLDLVVANSSLYPNKVFFNNGHGVFTDSGQNLGASTTLAVALGDVDHDGDLDMVEGLQNAPDIVWLNDGHGMFTDSGQRLGPSTNNTEALVLGDLDGDGDLDLVEGNYYNQPNHIWLNDSHGAFTDTGQNLGASSTISLALGDVDRDGDLDIVDGNIGQPTQVWINNGSAVFTSNGQALGNTLTTSVALGDVDADGDLDIVEGNTTQPNKVWLNNGNGQFTDSGQNLGSSSTSAVVLSDVDDDHDLDIVEGNYNQPNRVWLNNGSGIFTDSGQNLGQSRTESVAVGDVNGDGWTDVVIGNSFNPSKVLFNGVSQESSAPAVLHILALDVAPAGSPIPAMTVNEGVATTPINLNSYFSDVAADLPLNFSYSHSQGGLGFVPVADPAHFSVTFPDNGLHTITVQADDGDGPITWSFFQVNVLNVAPTNTAAIPAMTVNEGAPTAAINLNDFFSDVPADLPLSFSYSDGAGHTGIVADPSRFSLTYDDNGIYVAMVTAHDKDGGASSLNFTVNVLNTNPSLLLPIPTITAYEGVPFEAKNLAGFFTDVPADLPLQLSFLAVGDSQYQSALTFHETGTFHPTLKAQDDDGGNISLAVTITVKPTNDAPYVVQAEAPALSLMEGATSGAFTLKGYDPDLPSATSVNFEVDGVLIPSSGPSNPITLSNGILNPLGSVTADGHGGYSQQFTFQPTQEGSFQLGYTFHSPKPGTFAESQFGSATAITDALAVGDVDRDGDLDIVTGALGSGNKVWKNNGNGTLTEFGPDLGSAFTVSVTLGDIDGDGDLDLVQGNIFPGGTRVWKNDGTGIFTDTGQALGTIVVESVALGDVDGDGDLDLVQGNREPDRVWLNDGSGRFTDSGQAIGTNVAWTWSVVVGDVDRDGDLDFVQGKRLGPASVYLNNGNGSFTDSGQSLGASDTWTWSAALVDVDQDSDLDYVAGNYGGSTQIWINDGSGHFNGNGQPSLPVAITRGIAFGDLDGAGYVDLFQGTYSAPDKILLNNGAGVFTDSGLALGNYQTEAVAVADLNNDGWLDLIEANRSMPNRVYLNAAQQEASGLSTINVTVAPLNDPPFISAAEVPSVTADEGVASSSFTLTGHDLDKPAVDGVNFVVDGQVISNSGPLSPISLPSGTLTPVSGVIDDGQGGYSQQFTFTPADSGSFSFSYVFKTPAPGFFGGTGTQVGSGQTRAIAFGDLDGDGDLDLVQGNNAGPGKVWLNDGHGGFVDSGQSIGSSKTYAVALGDVDGDRDLDIVEGTSNGGTGEPNRVWLNDGHGIFSDSGQLLGRSSTVAVVLADLDGDRDLDIVEGNYEAPGPNRVYFNDGHGVFADSGQSLGTDGTKSIALGDVDGDGDQDIVEGYESQPIKIWINDGRGFFTNSGQSLGAFPTYTYAVALADVDHDGDQDIVEAKLNQPGKVWTNDGTGRFADSGRDFGALQGQGWTLSAVTGDINADGYVDIAQGTDGHGMRLWFNDGTGGFLDSGQAIGSSLNMTMALGDLNGDGWLDIGNGWGGTQIYFNTTAQESSAPAVLNITALNVAPATSGIPPMTANEGAATPAINLNTFFHDVPADPLSFTYSVDSGPWAPVADPYQFSHTFSDNGPHLISVYADDGDGYSTGTGFNVNVLNVAPIPTAPIFDMIVNEGAATAAINLHDFFTDVPTDLALRFTYSQDGGAFAAVTDPAHFSLTFPDNGSHTITVRADDRDGGLTDATFAVNVLNVEPTNTATISRISVNEGSATPPIDLNSFFSDAPGDLPLSFTYSVDGEHVADVPDPTRFSLTFPDDGSHIVTVRANDGDGGFAWTSFSVDVLNVPPARSVPIPDLTINEGTTTPVIDLNGYFSDVPADLALRFSYSQDSGAFVAVADPSHFSLVYPNSGSHIIEVRAEDGDGAEAFSRFSVNVLNVAPTALGIPDMAATEGRLTAFINLNSYFSDAPADLPLAFTYDDGNGHSGAVADPSNFSLFYPDQGVHTVTVTARDSDGAETSSSFHVNVDNAPPVVTLPIFNMRVPERGDILPLDLSVHFSDVPADLPLTYTYDDGNGHSGAVVDPGKFFPSYGDQGVFTASVTAHDGDGGSTTQSFTVQVDNMLPVATAAIANMTVDEGMLTDQIDLNAFFSDVPADLPLHFSYHDETGPTLQVADPAHFSLTYPDQGFHVITVIADDGDGEFATSGFLLDVRNLPPAASPIPDMTILEGQASPEIDLTSHFSDVASDQPLSFQYRDHLGYGRLIADPEHFSLTYADNGDYAVMVTATDKDAASTMIPFVVHVHNVDPSVLSAIPDVTLDQGAATPEINLRNIFSDVPSDLPLRFVYDDGQGQRGFVTDPEHFSLAYSTPGTYTAGITALDKDGGSSVATFNVTVNSIPVPVALLPDDLVGGTPIPAPEFASFAPDPSLQQTGDTTTTFTTPAVAPAPDAGSSLTSQGSSSGTSLQSNSSFSPSDTGTYSTGTGTSPGTGTTPSDSSFCGMSTTVVDPGATPNTGTTLGSSGDGNSFSSYTSSSTQGTTLSFNTDQCNILNALSTDPALQDGSLTFNMEQISIYDSFTEPLPAEAPPDSGSERAPEARILLEMQLAWIFDMEKLKFSDLLG